MPSVWHQARRAALVLRARSLTPAHTAKWGRFTVAGMMAHLNDSLRMAFGELHVEAKAPSFLKLAPVRFLAIHLLPMPKGAPTAPELLARSAGADLSREIDAFVALVARFAEDDLPLADAHPALGRMTRDDWGALIHKHTDHHLRQFGV